MDKNYQNITNVRSWRGIMIFAFAMSMLISVLLIANYFQLNRIDPVNSKVIITLEDKLNSNPGDVALRNEIRELDLLARKAYFTNQWQIRFGGYLLLAFVLLMIIAALILDSFGKKIEPVREPAEYKVVYAGTKARKWIARSGITIAVVALVLAFITHRKIGSITGSVKTSGDVPVSVSGDAKTITDTTKNIKHELTTAKDTVSSVKEQEKVPVFPTSEMKRNFPSFRGAGGNGIVYCGNLPESWDGAKGKNIKWKASVPLPGNNSPVIWGNMVFLCGADSKKQEVYCFNINSGKMFWETELRDIPGVPANSPVVSVETGFSAPTATCDGENVYAMFANGNIIALNMKGEKVWARNLGLPDNHYGHASSLYVIDGKVIVQFDQDKSCHLLALSAKSGNTVWNTVRDSKISWASPVIVNTGKAMEILLVGEPYVISYDPSSGKELWKTKCISGEVGPSVAYANGIIFTVNDNDRLSAFRPGNNSKILWEHNDYLSDVPSPVANDKFLIIPTSYGEVACYEPVTGVLYWHHDFGTGSYASPLIAGDKVYLLDKNGTMHIFKAAKVFSLVGEPVIPEKNVYATPAFAEGIILIRAGKNLYCIGN